MAMPMSTLLLSFPQIVVRRLYILPVAVYYYKVGWKPVWGDATPTSLCICQSCSGEHNKQPNAIKDQPAKPARKYYASWQHAINLNTVKTIAKLSTQYMMYITFFQVMQCTQSSVWCDWTTSVSSAAVSSLNKTSMTTWHRWCFTSGSFLTPIQ